MRVRFGEFDLDEEAHELRRDGQRVEIRPKVLEFLEALVHARPGAMSRAALSDRLWPATAVAYTSLPGVAGELRRALADDPAKPRFVRTIRGFGYAFIAAAVETSGKPSSAATYRCALEWSGREIGLADGETIIGRAEGCTIRIDSRRISRQHARIFVDTSGLATLEDLGSKNGTFLRGVGVTATTPLADGDEIAIGPALLIFRAGFGPGTTAI